MAAKRQSSRTPLVVGIGFVAVSLFSYMLAKGAFRGEVAMIAEIGTSAPSSADVVIAGAGTGGVAAAVQAARLGATVVLIEESDWIGGQMTAAGVTTLDIANVHWYAGILKEYVEKALTYHGSNSVEPRIGRQILMDLLAKENGVTLLLRERIESVEKNGSKITGVTLKSRKRIQTKVLIDATEYGDVLIKAGADYRLGNGTSSSPNSEACIQDITYTSTIKKYAEGVPVELQLRNPPPGYTQTVRDRFAKIVSNTNAYGPNDTWLTSSQGYPVSWKIHQHYRRIPDKNSPNEVIRTGVNWANDFPGHGATLSNRYITDRAYRQQMNCEAKLLTLQFLYYMQNDLGEKSWSVDNGQGFDTPYNLQENSCPNIPSEFKVIERHMPVIPYVRESARIIGRETVVAKDIARVGEPPAAAKRYASSIAVGDYHTDLHNCASESDLESSLEKSSDSAYNTGPFQLPLEALISRNIEGLIAAEKNISVSRLVAGASRLQPITMMTGQAAGALAAIAAKENTAPQNVAQHKVQSTLIANNSFLYPYTDIKPGDNGFAAAQEVSMRGIAAGTSQLTFAPRNQLTRETAIVMLLRAAKGSAYTPPPVTQTAFTDVPAAHWSSAWIHAAVQEGISSGCGSDKFCPGDSVTRAQMAVFLLKTKLGNSYNPPPATGVFSDLPTSHWAAAWAEDLYKRGFTSGCSSAPLKYCPDTTLTRIDGVTLIVRTFPWTSSATPPPNSGPPDPPSSPAVPGDLTNDGHVNLADYNVFMGGYGTVYSLSDYNMLIENFGR